MSKLIFTGLLIFAISALNLQAQQNKLQNKYIPRKNGREVAGKGYAGAMEYYKTIKANPETGTISAEEIESVKKQLSNFTAKTGNLNWNNLGPKNKGGRTRAILVDRNNSSVLYAGGVGGGLWKSSTGGTSWIPAFMTGTNVNISSITQDANGIIYFGTGEYFATPTGEAAGSTGFLGGGIYKSTDANGNDFTLITNTAVTANNSPFAYVNRLEAAPTGSRVYAATNSGLKYTEDGGSTWVNPVIYPASAPYTSPAYDIDVANDGSVYAVVGNKVFYSPNGNQGTFTLVSPGTFPMLSAGNRVEIAVAPSDPNICYAVTAKSGALFNIYRTSDKGATWSIIGPGGSANFNVFGDNNQGFYDNIISVFPNNPNKIIVGGIDCWEYTYGGNWVQKSLWYLEENSTLYNHADHHAIVFDKNNPNKVYFGTDGGVSVSSNGGNTFTQLNRNYATLQFYGLSANVFGQLLGGTQDNGTVLMRRQAGSEDKAVDFLGGDGGWTAMSYINPSLIVGTVYYGDMSRSFDFGATTEKFYNARMNALNPGTSTFAPFVTPLLLDEKINDLNSPDSLYYHNTGTNTIPAGTSVIAKSSNNNFPFLYTLSGALAPGDSVKIQDRVQARFYLGGNNAIYMTKKLHYPGIPSWFKIGTISGATQSMAVSADGDKLFVGTSGGRIYRISNLLQVKDSLNADITSASCVVVTDLIYTNGEGRAITSIATDPSNNARFVFTLGNYGKSDHVYVTTNALDATPTFTNKTGNLPQMPVYSAMIEVQNPNTILIGTEFGVFSTDNINVSPNWVEENQNLGRVPTYVIKQQQLNFPNNTNYGVIYLGTHGRGIWESQKYAGINNENPTIKASNVNIFPNPVLDESTLSFNSGINENAIIYVFADNGQVVYAESAKINQGANSIKINFAKLNPGNYFIVVKGEQNTFNGKLIKM